VEKGYESLCRVSVDRRVIEQADARKLKKKRVGILLVGTAALTESSMAEEICVACVERGGVGHRPAAETENNKAAGARSSKQNNHPRGI